MEGRDVVFFNDTKTIVTYFFQIFGGTDELLITDSSISSMQRLATGLPIAELAMDLLVNFVIEHKIVVGQGGLKKIGDDINVQICSWRKRGVSLVQVSF